MTSTAMRLKKPLATSNHSPKFEHLVIFSEVSDKRRQSTVNGYAMKIKSAIVGLLLFIGGATLAYFAFKTHAGVHHTREEAGIGGLPQNATDVNHWMKGTYPNRVYDFVTDEESFNTWRTTFGSYDLERQKLPFPVLTFDFTANKFVEHEITNGIVYYWHQPEGDQSLTVAYDRESGRSYFHEATR